MCYLIFLLTEAVGYVDDFSSLHDNELLFDSNSYIIMNIILHFSSRRASHAYNFQRSCCDGQAAVSVM